MTVDVGPSLRGVYTLKERPQHEETPLITQTTITDELYSCSCYRSNPKRNNGPVAVFCRHIVYLCATVAHIYDPRFYNKRRKLYTQETRLLIGQPPQTLSPTHSVSSKSPAPRTCVICLEEILINQSVPCRFCQNVYHNDCVQQWVLHSPSCPCCRNVGTIARTNLV